MNKAPRSCTKTTRATPRGTRGTGKHSGLTGGGRAPLVVHLFVCDAHQRHKGGRQEGYLGEAPGKRIDQNSVRHHRHDSHEGQQQPDLAWGKSEGLHEYGIGNTKGEGGGDFLTIVAARDRNQDTNQELLWVTTKN